MLAMPSVAVGRSTSLAPARQSGQLDRGTGTHGCALAAAAALRGRVQRPDRLATSAVLATSRLARPVSYWHPAPAPRHGVFVAASSAAGGSSDGSSSGEPIRPAQHFRAVPEPGVLGDTALLCQRSQIVQRGAAVMDLCRRSPESAWPRGLPTRMTLDISRTPMPPMPQLPLYGAPCLLPEPEPHPLLGLSFSDISYYVNVIYWTSLLFSIVTGNELLSRLSHFAHYTTGMFVLSLGFFLFHVVRFLHDMHQRLQNDARTDWRELLRFAWLSVFWAGFVLWYATPPVTPVAEWAGTPGAVAAVFGLAISLAAVLHTGMFSFMGEPQVPRSLHTTGVFALLRHPQSLGNILFLVGFSLAGGAVWASAAFAAAFLIYSQTVVPREERMLTEAFGDKYRHYVERVPRYAWALVLLLILEVFLLWRFQPWAAPIEVAPPPVGA
eukprot:scaffold2.g7341.t1